MEIFHSSRGRKAAIIRGRATEKATVRCGQSSEGCQRVLGMYSMPSTVPERKQI